MSNPPADGFTGEGPTYDERRTRRRHRLLLVGYALCVALWLLSTIPLARLSSGEGGGAAVTTAYLAAGLLVALVIRGIYTVLRRRPLWSPWLFVIAAVFTIAGYGVQTGGDEPFRPEAASGTELQV